MRVEASQFRVGVARTAVRQRPSGSSLVKDVDSNSVKSDGLSESLFGSCLGVVGDVVERRCGGSQLVGFVVEALRHGRDAALVYSFFAEVAGNFFDSEHVETEVDRAVDAGPEVRLFTFGRWKIT